MTISDTSLVIGGIQFKGSWMALLLAALLLPQPAVASETDKHLVVQRTTTGVYGADSKKTNMLFPAEAVELMGRSGDRVLVRRFGEQPSWEVRSQAENELAKTPLWISSSDVIGRERFRKVDSWAGEGRYIWCEASCDSGEVIDFRSDGSYISGYEESSDSSKTQKTTGHLYRSGQILWLRPDDKSLPGGFLYIRQDGTLCSPVQCFGSQ